MNNHGINCVDELHKKNSDMNNNNVKKNSLKQHPTDQKIKKPQLTTKLTVTLQFFFLFLTEVTLQLSCQTMHIYLSLAINT